jgi:4'-phosphopantetheinyl transferase EntD
MKEIFTQDTDNIQTQDKDTMAEKMASTVQCVLNRQVEPLTGKWYTDKAIDAVDHHPVQVQ